MRMLCRLVILLALCTLLADISMAQEVTGNISGIVKDQSGAVVPNATVTVTNTDKNAVMKTVTTSSNGDFSATYLPIGRYSVTVEAAGFQRFTQKDIELHLHDRYTLNPTLQVGQTTQQVTVEASGQQVELQNQAAAGLISGTEEIGRASCRERVSDTV